MGCIVRQVSRGQEEIRSFIGLFIEHVFSGRQELDTESTRTNKSFSLMATTQKQNPIRVSSLRSGQTS